ncbi:MAG: hypothetical protein SNJ60_03480 [Pseudanabaenaceae cyanobacterium]
MEKGLLWLPLLGVFGALVWAGRREWQQVEAYQRWATTMERHKYDVCGVLGQQGDRLFWGPPWRGTVPANHFQAWERGAIARVQWVMNGRVWDAPPTPLPPVQTLALRLELRDGSHHDLGFTAANPEIAQGWYRFLQTWLESPGKPKATDP